MEVAGTIYRPQSKGYSAQLKVRQVLAGSGYRVALAKHNCAYDLLINESVRIEVKCAAPQWVQGRPIWRFNIHRHGYIKEEGVDLYVLRLEAIPYFKNALHLLFEAPVDTPTLSVSLRGLLSTYSPNAIAFLEFCKNGRREREAA